MKQDKAMLLADALESGDYRKAKGQLRKGNTNRCCCLGVACNVYAQANPKKVQDQFNPEALFGEVSYLPKLVQEWFGFKSEDGQLIFKGKDKSLAGLNDGNYSHAQLAQIIRDNYREL